MITRAHRFHGHASVRAVYKQGRSIRGPLFTIKVAARSAAKPYRLAVVVSRKVSKSAVVRNRIRRRLYEAVRTSNNPPAAGTDIVLTVFEDRLATIEATTLQRAIDEALLKIAS